MIERMLAGLVPLLFQRVKAISRADKAKFAEFIAESCYAYIDGEREEFDQLLAEVKLDEAWKTALKDALWNDETQVK